MKDGEWTEVDNGKLWSMEFHSKDAYSINFVFNNFHLSDSAILYIVNADGTMLYGPVTSKQNTSNGFFLTDLVQGDDVLIFLYEPNTDLRKSSLTIEKVVHAYRDLFGNFINGNLFGSESCNKDIVCYPDWSQGSDAIALVLLSSGTEWCSGSLLMTANQSFRPLFLSAFHCIDVSHDGILSTTEISDAQNWMFKYQYKKTTCNGSVATAGITYNGAQFRAAWNVSDFALMEMNTSLVGDTRFSWLGWDRTGTVPTSGVGIHHPSGDVMKISFETDQFQTSSWGDINNHWLVNFNIGVVEHGSSGSPIFDQNKRVVGQLHGNQNYNPNLSYCAQPRAEYGQFNRSWTGGLTNTTRLSNWLDPCNAGSITTNTSRTPTLSAPSLVCSDGATYTVSNVPAGYTVTWSCSANLTFDHQPGNPKVFYAIGNGTGTVTATINSTTCGSVNLPAYTVLVGTQKPGPVSIDFDAPPGRFTASIDAVPTATSYKWYCDGVLKYANGTTIAKFVRDISNCEHVYYVDVASVNTCGVSEVSHGEVSEPPCDYLIITPNPGTDNVLVTISSPASRTSTNVSSANMSSVSSTSDGLSSYTVRIFDSFGVLYGTFTKTGDTFTVPVNNLKEGTYIVTVGNNVKNYSGKLLIKR